MLDFWSNFLGSGQICCVTKNIFFVATAERFIYSMRAPRNKEHHIVKAKLIVPLPYMILVFIV